MTDRERKVFQERCGQILHMIFVEIRSLTWPNPQESPRDDLRLIEELADLAHNIPLFMVGRDDSVPAWLRDELIAYSRKRWPESDAAKTKFVEALDMDDATFFQRYGRYQNFAASADKKAG